MLACVLVACQSAPEQQAATHASGAAPTDSHALPFTVTVIAFNDFHGHLRSSATGSLSTTSTRVPVGSAEFLAAHVARLKARRHHSVVVAAGDLVGASPLLSATFHDEPTIEAMNRLGLEFSSVGNHEFDQGVAELLRLQHGGCRQKDGAGDPNSCRGAEVGAPVPFEGAKFQYLAANAVDRATGRTVLPAYGVKAFRGVKVAFVGVTLRGTGSIVGARGVAGVEFWPEARAVNELVPELRAQGIEAVVVLLHQGGTQTGTLQEINDCVGQMRDQDLEGIVAAFDDIVDAVVTGHTHATYNCRLPNAAGRHVPVTSAGAYGRVLTEIDLTIHPVTGNVVSVGATNRLVTRNDLDIAAHPEVAKIVAAYAKLADPLDDQVAGAIAEELTDARDEACNVPAGNLVADAQLAATAAEGALVAFTNPGGVRSPGFTMAASAREGRGEVTYAEAFAVQPFGNHLVTMSLSRQALKDALEQQFPGCRGQDFPRLLIPSAGFRYAWDRSRVCNQRIRDVTLGGEVLVKDGVVIEPARAIRVTVNSYLADGGDRYSTFAQGLDRVEGPNDHLSLVKYLSGYRPPAAPYPARHPADRGKPRIERLDGAPCR